MSVDETHFLSFMAIVIATDGTEGSNFHCVSDMFCPIQNMCFPLFFFMLTPPTKALSSKRREV